jgi:hypothetical protein
MSLTESRETHPQQSSDFEISVSQANDLFMGGANAGEVLSDKSPKLTFNSRDLAIQQYSLLFFSDLDDPGDLGFARAIAGEHGHKVIQTESQGKVRKGTMPHYRTYTLTDEGLFVSKKSGVIWEHHRNDPELRDLTLVTKNSKKAQEIFNEIHELPLNAKGRDVFKTIERLWDKKELIS